MARPTKEAGATVMALKKMMILLTTFLVVMLAVACNSEPAPSSQRPATANTTTAAQTNPTLAASAGTQASEATRVTTTTGSPAKINIVTTSNIIADWVLAVGQERVDVFSLLPPNMDPHTFQPGARDVAQVADAGLVLSVGLSLEADWLEDLVRNAASGPSVVVALGNDIDPLYFQELQDGHEETEAGAHDEEADGDEEKADSNDDDHDSLDPHFWFDPLRVKQAVNSIAAQLSTLDPEGQTFYGENAAVYNEELDALHTWIEERVARLPEERRLLVMSHDSFQYFAKRYGFEVVGAIFPVSTDSEPTAQELASLIETIEHENAPAVFAEKSHSQRLASRIAEETGATLVGGLYTGSLGEPGGDAGTYLDLMRYNVNTIVEALE